ALRADDRVEQDDRAERATDAVEKRETENFDCAATFHAEATWPLRSGDFADRDERELDARFAEPHAIADVDAHALRNALAIHERAVIAVIDEHELIAIAHERAVAT